MAQSILADLGSKAKASPAGEPESLAGRVQVPDFRRDRGAWTVSEGKRVARPAEAVMRILTLSTQAEDNNRSFVKISYFAPKVEVGRFGGSFTRRLTMVGHDGSNHTFAVQHPLPRGSRREEKMSQFFRMLNG